MEGCLINQLLLWGMEQQGIRGWLHHRIGLWGFLFHDPIILVIEKLFGDERPEIHDRTPVLHQILIIILMDPLRMPLFADGLHFSGNGKSKWQEAEGKGKNFFF